MECFPHIFWNFMKTYSTYPESHPCQVFSSVVIVHPRLCEADPLPGCITLPSPRPETPYTSADPCFSSHPALRGRGRRGDGSALDTPARAVFGDWLLSFNIPLSRSIHLIVHVTSFFLLINRIPLNGCTTFHPAIRHLATTLSSFQCLATVNIAAVEVCVQVLVQFSWIYADEHHCGIIW